MVGHFKDFALLVRPSRCWAHSRPPAGPGRTHHGCCLQLGTELFHHPATHFFFLKKRRLCLLDFNSVSFIIIYVDRPSDGIYHSLPVQEEEPGRSYHVSFPCQRWLSGRNSFPDTTVAAWRWAIHGATIRRWISPWAHTQWKGMFALIAY